MGVSRPAARACRAGMTLVSGSPRRRALLAVLVLAVLGSHGTRVRPAQPEPAHRCAAALDQRGALGHAHGEPEARRRPRARGRRRAHPRRAPRPPPPRPPRRRRRCRRAPAGTPTSSQLRAAVRSGHDALLPEDRDAGWERLTERYQRTTARNRDYYEFVRARSTGCPGGGRDSPPPRAGSVTATVTYHYDDGRVFVERTSYRLVPQGGGAQDRPVHGAEQRAAPTHPYIADHRLRRCRRTGCTRERGRLTGLAGGGVLAGRREWRAAGCAPTWSRRHDERDRDVGDAVQRDDGGVAEPVAEGETSWPIGMATRSRGRRTSGRGRAGSSMFSCIAGSSPSRRPRDRRRRRTTRRRAARAAGRRPRTTMGCRAASPRACRTGGAGGGRPAAARRSRGGPRPPRPRAPTPRPVGRSSRRPAPARGSARLPRRWR